MNPSGSTINFPFSADVRGEFQTTSDRAEIIAQAIQDVLETRQGERVMLPDYGIADFVFSVQDFSFGARLAYHLEEQIRKYVPLVKNVVVKPATDDEGRAIVELQYTDVNEIETPRSLVFPVWRLRA